MAKTLPMEKPKRKRRMTINIEPADSGGFLVRKHVFEDGPAFHEPETHIAPDLKSVHAHIDDAYSKMPGIEVEPDEDDEEAKLEKEPGQPRAPRGGRNYSNY